VLEHANNDFIDDSLLTKMIDGIIKNSDNALLNAAEIIAVVNPIMMCIIRNEFAQYAKHGEDLRNVGNCAVIKWIKECNENVNLDNLRQMIRLEEEYFIRRFCCERKSG
jgi:hypothetical protein